MGLTTGSLGTLALAGQAAGGAASTVGAYYGAKSQKTVLNGQATMADLNAQQAELAAQQELARGNAQIAQITARAGQVKGAQRAALAANGIDLGDGSAAEVLTSTDIAKETDMNQAQVNAINAAWGYRKQGTNYSNQALAARASADSISPGMAAATSLLGSATQVAGSWYNLNKGGVSAKGT